MARRGVLAGALVVLAALALLVVPWAARKRDIPAAVPSPRALFRVDAVTVAPGATACSPDVGVDPHAADGRIVVQTGARPGPPLAFDLRAPGWTAHGRVAGGYADGANLSFAIPSPPRAVLARACVRNAGRTPVTLDASGDRTRSRSITEVSGRSSDRSAWLTFGERGRHSLLDRAATTAQRMTVFRPGIVGPWLIWLLAGLVLAAVPAGVLWAWQRGLRAEEDDA